MCIKNYFNGMSYAYIQNNNYCQQKQKRNQNKMSKKKLHTGDVQKNIKMCV